MKPQDRTRAILTSRLDAQSKLVAVAIADHMDVHDTSFPSAERIAHFTSLAERTVRTVIQSAIADGWLKSPQTPGRAHTFTFDWARIAIAGPRQTMGRKVAKDCTGRTPAPAAPLHGAHPTPARGAPGGVHGAPEPLHGAHPKRDHMKQTSEATTGGLAREEEGRSVSTPSAPTSPPAESHPPAAPSTADTSLVVNGIELPRDLPALLSTIHPGFMHYIRMLLPAGVTTTEHLLRVPREEWKFMGHGLNAAKVNAIGDHLRNEWGVDLGALAKADAKAKAHPKLFAPKSERTPTVDDIDHLFRKKDTPREVTRAE